jgi:hypothetical protein
MESEGPLPFSKEYTISPMLNQINPVHNLSHYFANIHFNIIFPFMPKHSSVFGRSNHEDKLACSEQGKDDKYI